MGGWGGGLRATGDDCDEDEAIVALAWVPPTYVDWYVAVEPVEPQLVRTRRREGRGTAPSSGRVC